MTILRNRRAIVLSAGILAATAGLLACRKTAPHTGPLPFYVATTGDDGRGCAAAQTLDTPLRTIAAGIACLQQAAPNGAGQTLQIRGGTYAEQISDPALAGTSWDNKVLIEAYPGEVVTLKPTSGTTHQNVMYFGNRQQYIEFNRINLDCTAIQHSCVKVEAYERDVHEPHHLRWRDATLVGPRNGIENEMTNAPHVFLLVSTTPGLRGSNELLNLTATGCGDAGDDCYFAYIGSSNNVLDGNDISGMQREGIQLYPATAEPTGNIIRNNRIHGLRAGSGPYGDAIVNAGINTEIYNNVIYDLGTSGAFSGIVAYYGSRGSQVRFNTVYRASLVGIHVADGSGHVVEGNVAYDTPTNFQNDVGAGAVAGLNSFDGTDPRFTNPQAADFTLQKDSPLVDAAGASTSAPPDAAGTPRPQGAAADIGAFETPGTTPPTPPVNGLTPPRTPTQVVVLD